MLTIIAHLAQQIFLTNDESLTALIFFENLNWVQALNEVAFLTGHLLM